MNCFYSHEVEPNGLIGRLNQQPWSTDEFQRVHAIGLSSETRF